MSTHLSQRNHVIEQLLEHARQELDMGIAYYSEFTQQAQVVQQTTGDDTNHFGLPAGTSIPLEQTYCRSMLEGIEPKVTNVGDSDILLDLDLDKVASCYMGAPLRSSDGRIFGSVCCLSTEALENSSFPRYEHAMQSLADSIAREIESDQVTLPDPKVEANNIQLSVWFSGITQAPQAARNALQKLEPYLGKRQLSDLRLLITELVTNSIRHAELTGEETVGLDISIKDGMLHGQVTDPGVGFIKPEQPKPHDHKMGGYGLVIMDFVTEEWGVEHGNELFCVWFCMKTH